MTYDVSFLVLCRCIVCYICSQVAAAGTATAAGWRQGARYNVILLLGYCTAGSLSLLAAVAWHLSHRMALGVANGWLVPRPTNSLITAAAA